MKYLPILALSLVLGCSDDTPQKRFRFSAPTFPEDVVLSTVYTNGGHILVLFRWPLNTTNLWHMEWTTNFTEWHPTQNETILPGGLRYVEGNTWGTNRYWRLKKGQ